MAAKRKPPSTAEYWSGIQQSINARLIALKNYLKHPASGPSIEEYFRDLLREYLPNRYAVESGFVVNAAGDRSDHLDVVIADLHHIPPLCSEPLLKVYAAEAVVAAVEITSAPKASVRSPGIGNIPKLADDILKLARLRQLARNRKYLDSSPIGVMSGKTVHVIRPERLISFELSPRAFLIVCGDEWKNANTLQRHLDHALRSAKQRNSHAWINAVFSVQHGMIRYKPETDHESEQRAENGLLEFILFLNKVISDYPMFRIDITRYRPTLPTERPITHEITIRDSLDLADRGSAETGGMP